MSERQKRIQAKKERMKEWRRARAQEAKERAAQPGLTQKQRHEVMRLISEWFDLTSETG